MRFKKFHVYYSVTTEGNTNLSKLQLFLYSHAEMLPGMMFKVLLLSSLCSSDVAMLAEGTAFLLVNTSVILTLTDPLLQRRVKHQLEKHVKAKYFQFLACD